MSNPWTITVPANRDPREIAEQATITTEPGIRARVYAQHRLSNTQTCWAYQVTDNAGNVLAADNTGDWAMMLTAASNAVGAVRWWGVSGLGNLGPGPGSYRNIRYAPVARDDIEEQTVWPVQ